MRDKIINQAELLFFQKGYGSVSLQSICAPLKIKPASIYYHFKGGKEELYLEVIKKNTTDFRAKIESIAFEHDSIETILKEFGYWYTSQPPMNMMLIAQMDMPFLTKKSQAFINKCVANDVFNSLGKLFERYKSVIRQDHNPYMLVGTLSVLLFSIHTSLKMSGAKAKDLVDYNVTIFLEGAGLKNTQLFPV